jgi:hypothetical protein
MTITIDQADDETVNSNRRPWLRAALAGFVAVVLIGGVAIAVARAATDSSTAAGPASAAPIAGVPTTPTTWGPSSVPGVEVLPDENAAPDSLKRGRPGTPAPVGSQTAPLGDEPIVADDGATFGPIPAIAAPGVHVETLTADYVPVVNPDGTIAGYFRSDEMYPATGSPALIDMPDGVPVYAGDGSTIVGRITRDGGYAPLGNSFTGTENPTTVGDE